MQDFNWNILGNSWKKLEDTWISTASISNWSLLVTWNTSYPINGWYNRNDVAKNFIYKIQISDWRFTPQIQFRYKDKENFLLAYVWNAPDKLYLAIHKNSSSLIALKNLEINFNPTDNDILVVKSFNNHVSVHLVSQNLVGKGVIDYSIGSNTEASVWTKAWVSVSWGDVKYDNQDFKRIQWFRNIVCVWDSNTMWIQHITNLYDRYSDLININFIDEPTVCLNHWYNWATTTSIQSKMTELWNRIVTGADNIVTFMIWTNDWSVGKTVADTWEDYKATVAIMQQQGWRVICLTYIPFNSTSSTVRNDWLKELNVLIRENWDNLDYTWIDLWDKFVDSDDNSTKSGLIVWDNLHLSEAWHRLIADTIIAEL